MCSCIRPLRSVSAAQIFTDKSTHQKHLFAAITAVKYANCIRNEIRFVSLCGTRTDLKASYNYKVRLVNVPCIYDIQNEY